MPKIIQLLVVPADHEYGFSTGLWALCDDGTIWWCDFEDRKWNKFPNYPEEA